MSDKPIVYLDDNGTPTYRPSAIYNCLSVLVAARLGLEPKSAPGWMQERFNEGHAYEDTILERARLRGFTFLYGFQMEVTQKVGPAQMVGHIDALGAGAFIPDTIDGLAHDGSSVDLGVPILIDAKAFAESSWEKWTRTRDPWAAFPYYSWQMTTYSKALGNLPIAMAIGLKDREHYQRTGETRLIDFRLDLFTKPPMSFGRIMARILEVERLAAKGVDGIPGTCDNSVFPCPYFTYPFHTEKEQTALEVPEGERFTELVNLAEERTAIYRQIKDLETRLGDLDRQMLATVGEEEGNIRFGDASSVISSASFYRSMRSEIDWDAVRLDYPDFDRDSYTVKRPSSKLSVRLNPKRAAKVDPEVFVE